MQVYGHMVGLILFALQFPNCWYARDFKLESPQTVAIAVSQVIHLSNMDRTQPASAFSTMHLVIVVTAE